MELPRGFRPRPLSETKNLQNELCPDTLLVIKLPDTYVLRVMSRSVFWAVVLLSLPFFGSIFGGIWASLVNVDDMSVDSGSGLVHFEGLDSVFQDLSNEGFIKKGDKALIVGSSMVGNSLLLNGNGIDLVLESDLERLATIADEMFDIAVVSGSIDAGFVDHVVKVGGIVVIQLNNGIYDTYERFLNYRIEYLRRYDFTFVAMRKTGLANELMDSPTRRRLYQLTLDEGKKAASNDLEDVLKKIKFLPDLLGDFVGSYSHSIFIDVVLAEKKGGMMEWFQQNYPMGNEFAIYYLKMMPEEEVKPGIDVSDWLENNVKKEEYVVMKVEAEVADEMIKRETICLVDEMFLECKNQWQAEGKERNEKGKRAFWECLDLYERLRDEGVAVHPWWG